MAHLGLPTFPLKPAGWLGVRPAAAGHYTIQGRGKGVVLAEVVATKI